jgi:ATP-dependent helicase/nuclease subunit A
MSERAPTEEQRAAIETRSREVLVEAGAGTGKTGVMVERYCRLVCEQGVAPGSILAFTFTDKAAAELRHRIRAEIEQRAAGGSERARELLPTLGSAWVTTIHGFCNRLLSAHPVAVGIDPRFRVLDAAETDRAAAEAFDEALEAFLAAEDRGREDTVAAFDVGALRGMVLGVHAELRSRGETEPQLPDSPEPDVPAALRRVVATATEAAGELKPGSSNHELVERALMLIDGSAVPPSLDAMASLRTESKAKPIAAFKEAVEAAVSRIAEAGEGGRAYRHLTELLQLFSERFAAVKERRAGIDFEDLQLLAVRLLEQETGAAYRARFSHLLVDEFQDTNRLQLRLIEALRGPQTQLMVVGDELQSIYGFRHADLDVFRERRRAIETSASGATLPLSGNFRSRPEVIGAVNAIGEHLLGAYAPLRVGAPPRTPHPRGDGPAVEVLLTGRDGWEDEGVELDPATDARTPLSLLAEARFVAKRLRALADSGIGRGEMVVLLRAFTHLDAYEDSLERAGLRPYVVGGRGYWSQQQVADVCALLATIANPLDDQALLGTLASPACGVAPDTLWLLRAAAGANRHIWPAVERASGAGEDELADPERLVQIPPAELALLSDFVATLNGLRRRAGSLPLAGLVDAAVTETGYDLAVLMRPAGESRFANVRKLMRLAAEFETAEGRDLRGLLDFLAARAGADAESQAATAIEGHDGVRIMTTHSAKGLEFDVVAIPILSRSLLPPVRAPLVTLGQEQESPRVGMQLRRLGARAINLYAQRELCEEGRRRAAEEELRLFHVGATRARERLLLSGVISPSPPSRENPGKAVIERIVAAFEIDRERDSAVAINAPEPRPGLEETFKPSEMAVRVSLASAERAAELSAVQKEPDGERDLGAGPAPLVARRQPRAPQRPLSYTAIVAHRGAEEQALDGEQTGRERGTEDEASGEGAAARGRAVHLLLEWSQANGWQEPSAELIRRVALSAEVAPHADLGEEDLRSALRTWLGSSLFLERVRDAARSRAEVPLLIEVAGNVLRGSIDLLVENDDRPPLLIDYKTDRVDGSSPTELARRYEVQQAIYALSVAEARQAEEVELAYVFLERPEDPVLIKWGTEEIAAARRRLEDEITRVRGA